MYTGLALFPFALGFVIKNVFHSSLGKTATKVKDVHDKNEETQKEIAELRLQLALVGASVAPISVAFQAILIKELTHFTLQRWMRCWLRSGPPNVLSDEEFDRLAVMLAERSKDLGEEMSARERDAAFILPAVMRRVSEELKDQAEKADDRLVQ